jgi:hypothetical protein
MVQSALVASAGRAHARDHASANGTNSAVFRLSQRRIEKGTIMKTCLYLAAFSLALAGMAEPAAAKGCIRGAFMGGVAGHYVAHHGVLGAAAGCLIGRHEAKKHERERVGNDRSYDRSYDRGQPIGTTGTYH